MGQTNDHAPGVDAPARLRSLADELDRSARPFAAVSLSGEVLACNRACWGLLGLSGSEVPPPHWLVLTPPEWREAEAGPRRGSETVALRSTTRGSAVEATAVG